MKYLSSFSPFAAALATFAALALLASCDGRITTEPFDGDVTFRNVYQSQFSGIRDERGEIIENSAEWADVWDEITGGGQGRAPEIDFGREMLALVAAGRQPNGCYSVEIQDIEIDNGDLEVEADLFVPGAGCNCTDVVTSPVHVVRLRRIRTFAELDLREVVESCR